MKTVAELKEMEQSVKNKTYISDWEGVPSHEDLVEECNEQEGVRICDTCGSIMTEGICVEGGANYYCNKECMIKDGMTQETFDELYADGDGDTYWTEWEEDMETQEEYTARVNKARKTMA